MSYANGVQPNTASPTPDQPTAWRVKQTLKCVGTVALVWAIVFLIPRAMETNAWQGLLGFLHGVGVMLLGVCIWFAGMPFWLSLSLLACVGCMTVKGVFKKASAPKREENVGSLLLLLFALSLIMGFVGGASGENIALNALVDGKYGVHPDFPKDRVLEVSVDARSTCQARVDGFLKGASEYEPGNASASVPKKVEVNGKPATDGKSACESLLRNRVTFLPS